MKRRAPPAALPKIWKISRLRPSQMEALARGLNAGKIMLFPTDTVYGVGGNAFLKEAHARLFALKKRASAKPLPILVESTGRAKRLARRWTPAAEALSRRFWPGPLTLVFWASAEGRKAVQKRATIGLRVPKHRALLKVLKAAGAPLVSSSANLSGQPAVRTCREALRAFGSGKPGERVDFILDGGPCRGQSSTVVDLTASPPKILRAGSIRPEAIERALGSRKT
ncbi:MAG: threonylcarbamoyl-AMP synthase [Elusimicrobia bacterium RIFCSPLOWO2_12_FULL_59_9]|nr:MAG: threonylcarbamoyl-AMP synthase [Elusimicrobia bacterium RIFCSPLOWO2_12_FULL_59_9]